jgi:hypothetical protein
MCSLDKFPSNDGFVRKDETGPFPEKRSSTRSPKERWFPTTVGRELPNMFEPSAERIRQL